MSYIIGICDNDIIYLFHSKIYKYNIITKEHNLVYDDFVVRSCIYNGNIIILDNKSCIHYIPINNHYAYTKYYLNIPITYTKNLYIKICEKLICISEWNYIYIINLETSIVLVKINNTFIFTTWIKEFTIFDGKFLLVLNNIIDSTYNTALVFTECELYDLYCSVNKSVIKIIDIKNKFDIYSKLYEYSTEHRLLSIYSIYINNKITYFYKRLIRQYIDNQGSIIMDFGLVIHQWQNSQCDYVYWLEYPAKYDFNYKYDIYNNYIIIYYESDTNIGNIIVIKDGKEIYNIKGYIKYMGISNDILYFNSHTSLKCMNLYTGNIYSYNTNHINMEDYIKYKWGFIVMDDKEIYVFTNRVSLNPEGFLPVEIQKWIDNTVPILNELFPQNIINEIISYIL